MHSSSSTSLSSLTDNTSTDDSVKVAKFPVSKNIPNIPDNYDSMRINDEITEDEVEEGEYIDDDKMINNDQSIIVKKQLSMPLLYQMNLNKNKNIHGTVTGPSDDNFHPIKASEKLRQALNGLDTNEKAIIEILMDDLKDELGGFFLDTISSLFIPTHFYLATLLHQSLCNYKLNRDVAVEIGCTRTTTQMKAIMNAYRMTYCSTLERDTVIKVEGIFGVMLQLLLCSPRNEQINETDMLIEKHVDLIIKDLNGMEEIGHNVELFEKLFIGHSWRHIAAVIDKIDAKLGGNGHFIETQIIYNGNIPSDIKNILLTIVTTKGPQDLEKGLIVGKRWRIIDKLGEGGCGAVYKVEDIQTFAKAALKAESNFVQGGSVLKLEVQD
ncbi:unnamed protein product [Acanthocheilonema viteae]|uniref:Protein kinase domain-containing protein n=1 Tax=Acanthocheilonema viteae TaxID=6277 RepID=A0A498SFG9_ACAVI|nr:unnamed protein product [Acanthocheilonema viteae]